MTTPLIDPDELAAQLASDAPPVVLDVRYRLDAPDGREAYRAGHVPGAVYVSLDDELAAHGEPEEGRHPLPSPAALQASARRWGLDDDRAVVVYDDWNSFAAARAWWMLADAGVDVRVLDGGWRAWRDAGLPLETGTAEPAPGNITLAAGRLPRLDIDQAAALAQEGVLLDVRAPERFRGEVEPIDPAAGHIPGARNAPTTGNLGPDGRFRPAAKLRERYAHLAEADAGAPETADPTIGVYCGSGVTASHAALALTLAGLRPALYPGSWSQWSNTPGRPIATGDEPGTGRLD